MKRPASRYPSHGRVDSASIACCPRTVVEKSLGARAPRKRVRVSESWPVTRSTSVRRSTPFCRPMLRKSVAASAMLASASCSLSPMPVSSISSDSGAAATACVASIARQLSGSSDRIRTVLSKHPTARNFARWRPSGTADTSRQEISPLISFLSTSTSCPVISISKYTSSPPLSASTTWRWLEATLSTDLRPGVFHSLTRRSARMCRSPPGCACMRESSPSCPTRREGVVPRKPLSFTSSTVSPMDSTRVALTKETTMYESKSSAALRLTVQTALGWPGSGDTAISVRETPCFSMRTVDRGPRPHAVTSVAVSSPGSSTACRSMRGQMLGISSMGLRLRSGRGSKNTGWKPSSVSMSVAELDSTSSSWSPMPANWYMAWLPNSDPAKRKPVLSTQMAAQVGMVSKYFIFSSVTTSASPCVLYSNVTL
mmetsp:Transcript_11543/g.24166  ORF Transcript_11543/g.24166 Transcript_11543/m.24166 type:complete len:427 (-) Transcript_11543:1073-2353(-)